MRPGDSLRSAKLLISILSTAKPVFVSLVGMSIRK